MAAPTSLHWQDLCASTGDDDLGIEDSIEELQKAPVQYDPKQVMPTSLAEVEMVRTMRFDPTDHMDQPKDLFTCGGGMTGTKLRDEYRYIFEHSACASFFAYLPLYFWKQVAHETNTYARVNQLAIGEPFKFKSMKILGILFYMEITVKGSM
ncbi:hypothetical protein PC116_g11874 [Phytophthora cactorum]|uniref:Uncharacterized protein n=1 Tax=Phytophthora cactorum TaxID=29920 RepID=A0A329RM33_9STRA|nr:hypothetical protein PC116_g11874 [Phytophthora cactorum]RAW25381.1 hypothetical protein PC110_g18202 [Phytophthora cactorum]